MFLSPIFRLPTKTISHAVRSFSIAPITAAQMPPRPVVPESDISESFLKGSGPGGQKINKTSSAVQLKHLPSGLVVKSQATRSRSQNRKIARRLLAEKLEVVEKGPESRMAMKEEGKRKRKASKRKKAKRKYRALEEGVDGGGEEEEEEEEEEEGGAGSVMGDEEGEGEDDGGGEEDREEDKSP